MKHLFTLLILVASFPAFSQKRLTEYKASNDVIYHEGDTIPLGMGSDPYGNFKHLIMGGWMTGDLTPIGKGYNGLNVVLKKIQRRTFKGAEKIFFTVGGGNLTNYYLIIEDAITDCEVIPCKEDVKNSKSNKFDDLAKLKKLYDDGVLTKEEYEAEKAKLLKKN